MLGSRNGVVLQRLQELILQGMPILTTSSKEDIFLVIGNTGAGKSTTINYFMGNGMGTERIRGQDRVVVTEARYPVEQLPVIGHSFASQTLYPQTYKTNEGVALCDCPGFFDNRQKVEAEICASIGIELAVKFANNIRGILLVIDYSEFTTGRAESFHKIIVILTKIFGNTNHLEDVFKSTAVVITKKPTDMSCEESKKIILAMIEASIEDCQEQLREYEQELDDADDADDSSDDFITIKSQIECLSFIRSQKEQLVVIQSLDGGESWNNVRELIQNFAFIDKAWFEFKQYNDNRIKFNDMIYETIGQLSQEIDLYREIISHLAQQELAWPACEEQIKFCETQIAFMKASREEGINNIKIQLDIINAKMNKNYHSIRLLNEEITINDVAEKNIIKDLEAIDNDNNVKYWEDSIFERRDRYFGFLSWTVRKFDYNGFPFTGVQLFCKSGGFYNEKKSQDKGTYSTIYKSGFGQDGEATVTVYVASRLEPGNALRILELKTSKDKLKSSGLKIKDQIRAIEADNQKLQRLLDELSEEKNKTEEEKNQTITEYREEINKNRELIVEIKRKISGLKSELAIKKIGIEARSRLFETLKKIIFTISFDSKLILSFKKHLSEYEACIFNRTDLHLAVLDHDISLVKVYSKRKDLINSQDNQGESPLHLAIKNNNVQCSFILLLEGADVVIRDNAGKRPIDLMLSKEVHNLSDDEKYLLAMMLMISEESVKFNDQGFSKEISILRKKIIALHTPFRKSTEDIIAHHIISQQVKNFDNIDYKSAFKSIKNFPELKILLDITAFSILAYNELKKTNKSLDSVPLRIAIEPLDSKFDLGTPSTIEKPCGSYDSRNNTIYLSSDKNDNSSTIGTLIHEITYFVASKVFDNNANPYFNDDLINKQRFDEICQNMQNKKNELNERLVAVFSYPSYLLHIELIVHLAQLIAISNGYKMVNQNCPELLKYYQEIFLPACQTHLEDLYYKHRIIKPSLLKKSNYQFLDKVNTAKLNLEFEQAMQPSARGVTANTQKKASLAIETGDLRIDERLNLTEDDLCFFPSVHLRSVLQSYVKPLNPAHLSSSFFEGSSNNNNNANNNSNKNNNDPVRMGKIEGIFYEKSLTNPPTHTIHVYFDDLMLERQQRNQLKVFIQEQLNDSAGYIKDSYAVYEDNVASMRFSNEKAAKDFQFTLIARVLELKESLSGFAIPTP